MRPLEEEISGFIVTNCLLGRADLAPHEDESLLESGVVDATGVLEVVAFLERRYGFKVAGDEVTPENLDSIGRLKRFVEMKLSSAADASG